MRGKEWSTTSERVDKSKRRIPLRSERKMYGWVMVIGEYIFVGANLVGPFKSVRGLLYSEGKVGPGDTFSYTS
jgi:hypothetical protein